MRGGGSLQNGVAEHMPEGEKVFRGIPVSDGVCRGKLFVLRDPGDEEVPTHLLGEHEVGDALRRFEHALADTRRQLREVQTRVGASVGRHEAAIFDAQLMVLEDPVLIEEITALIRRDRLNPTGAVHQVTERFATAFAAMEDTYLAERAADIRDVGERLRHNLQGREGEADLRHLTEPCIVVAHDLSPSRTAGLDRRLVLGFVTDIGSKTSHTAILARSLRIPAAVGMKDGSRRLVSGEYALLDGHSGQLILHPTDQTLFAYGQLVRRAVGLDEKLQRVADQPAVTLDGHRVILSANIETPDDIEAVRLAGADGVGLFRTEYLYINRDTLPDEESQYLAYRQVAAALKPAPVIIRTVDLGGDKVLSHLNLPPEINPFLGWRAIRFCLQETSVFCAQLRAILRAAVEGNIKIMYPMVSGVDEVVAANALLDQCRTELQAAGVPYGDPLDVGAMIEIPSAAMSAEYLARKVKFFSLGTNDLIQYTLAVDRLNERIAHLYEPTHPAILRLIQRTVEAGAANGVWTGVCGEMAGDSELTPLLLGLGVTELSAAPPLVPRIKYLIRRLRMPECRDLAAFALKCESGAEILRQARAVATAAAPELFDSSMTRV